MTNKEKAVAIITQGVSEGDKKVITQYVKEDYIQHNPVVPDGRAGVLKFIEKIDEGELPAPEIEVKRVMEDGNFVVVHSAVQWPNRKAMIEIFRFEEGMAAEHWSGIIDHPEKTANGHSMLDGATVITDRDQTQQNKAFVQSFVETVLIQGHFDKVRDYYHEDIIQHNPFIDNTVPGLIRGIQALQEQGITLQIRKIHQVLGEGNFVLTFSEGEFGGKPTAFFDLFRVEDGKIVEHWDVLQEVPEKMSHENGMFTLSLYKRLGGYNAIAGFVDLAFPRVAAHPDLSKYFVGHATESQYRQRQLIVDRLASITGGPVIYLGRSLPSVHKGLGITEEHWNAFMSIIRNAAVERNFPEVEKKEFLEIFENQFREATIEAEIATHE